MRRRPLGATAAGLVLAVGGSLVTPALAPAPAAGTPAVEAVAAPAVAAVAAVAAPPPPPAPSTTRLPVPRPTVDPRLAVGGARLASMGIVVDLPAGVPAPPMLEDVSWVLADLRTGDVIAAKAPHARLRPASTLKTLTALTLIPTIPASRRVTPTQADANADGTRVGVLPGYPYTAGQLFQALLMSSGNDAAYALARANGGLPRTLAAMNRQSAQLGAHDTVAKDPSGLDMPGQTSSAYDLALIGRAAMQLPDFRRYVATKQVRFPGGVDRTSRQRGSYVISNHNRLLHNYPGTIGIKNGYTSAAQRTFISAVTRGGRTYILTEMYGLNSSWRPQAAMYDWAFAHGAKARPVGRLVEPGEVPKPLALPAAPPVAPATGPPTVTAGPPSPTEGPAAATGAPGAFGAPAPPATARSTAADAVAAGDRLRERVAPWAGVAGLAAALLLVLLLGLRARPSRRHRSH